MKLYLLILASFISLQAQDDSWMLYDDSQVAIINITTSAEAVSYMYANPWSDSLHMATVHFSNAFIDETVDSVAIRIRGNTSRVSAKKSFKLDFEHFADGREFYNVDKMNINGEHNDPSVIRAKLAWDFFNEIGIAAARAAHAAVYINDVYYGLYISVEHYDREFLKKNFEDPDGNLWKCLYPAELLVRGSGRPQDYDPFLSGQGGYNLQTNEQQNDFSKLAMLIDRINNTTNLQFPIEMNKILEMNSFIKVMAMDVILGAWDDYWSNVQNYYLYYEPGRDRFWFIPYDYDNIMSIDWSWPEPTNWATEDIYDWHRLRNEYRPLVDRMLDNDQYYNQYTHFIDFYNTHVFAMGLWEDRLDSLYNKIRPFAVTDTFRINDWGFSVNDFDNSYGFGYENQHVKNGIRQYVTVRNSSIPQQIEYRAAPPVIYQLDYSPLRPVAGDSITISISAFDNDGITSVKLQYLVDGGSISQQNFIYNPVAGTKKVEEYDRWTTTIIAPGPGSTVQFIVNATDGTGSSRNYPALDLMTIQIPGNGTDAVIINEFLAQNNTGVKDENGQFEDWIELFNTSDQDVDLAGYHLSDRSDNLAKWQFPDSGSLIEAGGYLLIWCDEDQQQGVLHSNFKLSATGEFIALSGPDGVTVHDSLSFAVQSADISFGRQPDGSDNWGFQTPTPGSSNTVTAIMDSSPIPSDYKLSAYPNPFNSTVKINYFLESATEVSIRIFNMLGELVWQQRMYNQRAGSHILTWDGKGSTPGSVSSGLYLVQLKKGAKSEHVKIILIR